MYNIPVYSHDSKVIPIIPQPATNLTRPENQTIFGLVFYGRADRVRILNCYLERNLPEQGGWLDEIHFVRNTNNSADLAYLDELLATHPRYKMIELPNVESSDANDRYREAWSRLQRDTVYVKIDDDVVWIADDAIPRMVVRKLRQTDYVFVSASVINSPLMSKVHHDSGAYHAYLPAHNTSTDNKLLQRLARDKEEGRTRWEVDQYPMWNGPDEYSLSHTDLYNGHFPVWLRLPNSEIQRTPIAGIEYAAWGPGWNSWSIAAQSHLSLLENLYNGTTKFYFQNLEDEVWFTKYDRLSINLIAVWSNDILDNLPNESFDDEEWLSLTLPQKLQKNVAVETRALASHFSFGAQKDVETTDLLARYADYTRNVACLKKEHFGQDILGG